MSLSTDNLDDVTFDDLVNDSRSRITVYSPSWTNLNKSDPGVTLIELLSWLTEMQIYSLNRINQPNYLKFLKLLGIVRPAPARPAEGKVTFETTKDAGEVTVEEGTLVAAVDQGTGKQIIYQLIKKVAVEPGKKAVGQVVQGHLVSNEFNSDGLPDFSISLQERIVRPLNERVNKEYPLVNVDDKPWKLKEDLDSSKKSDTHYAADLENGIVFFGDNENGATPKEGAKIAVEYWTGMGTEGNLRKNSIDRILDPNLASKLTVINEEPVTGGVDAESLANAIERVRKDQRSVTRAVTTADYEQLALGKIDLGNGKTLEIDRTKAIALYHPVHDQPVPNIVSLVVIPKSNDPRPIPTQDELRNIYEHMSQCRMLGTELFVVPPKYIRISVKAELVRDLKYKSDTVKHDVQENLSKFLNPKTGGRDKSGWPFGGSVSVSQIYKVISEYGGVDHVTDAKIRKWNEGEPGIWVDVDGGKLAIPSHALVYVKDPLDNDIVVADPK